MPQHRIRYRDPARPNMLHTSFVSGATEGEALVNFRRDYGHRWQVADITDPDVKPPIFAPR